MKISDDVSPVYYILIFLLLVAIGFVIPNIIGLTKVPTQNNDQPSQNSTNPTVDNSTLPNVDNSTLIPSFKLSVVGNKIIDQDGKPVYLNGITLWGDNFATNSRQKYTVKRLNIYKEQGFNLVIFPLTWGALEPNRDGVYSKSYISEVEEMVDLADSMGFYIIISMRVSVGNSMMENDYWNPEWCYAGQFSDVYRPDTWFDFYTSYLNAYSYLIDTFDDYEGVIGYNNWFYPFHGIDPETGLWATQAHIIIHYEERLTPLFQEMLREKTDKIWFWSACSQGDSWTPEVYEIVTQGLSQISDEYPNGELMNDPASSTGLFDPDSNRTSPYHYKQDIGYPMKPIDDNNIVYCANFHRPWNVEKISREPKNWTGTDLQKAYIDEQLRGLNKFIKKYNVTGMIIEFALEETHTGDQPQYRIDCLDYKMKVLSEHGIHWAYFNQGRSLILNESTDWELNNVGELLVRYINK